MSIEVPVARSGARVMFISRYAGATQHQGAAGVEYQYWHQGATLLAGHTYYAFACGSAFARYDGTTNVEHRLVRNTTVIASARVGAERNGWANGKGAVSLRLEAFWRQVNDELTADIKWIIVPSADWNDWVMSDSVHTFGMIDLGKT